MRRKLFNNKKEYVKWARNAEVESDGMAKGGGKNERATGKLLENKPQRYPCITVYALEACFDRASGDNLFIFFDHIYLAEFTEGFNPNAEIDAWEAREKQAQPYFIALEKLRNMENRDYSDEECEKQYQRVCKLKTKEVSEFLTEYFGFEVGPFPKEYKRVKSDNAQRV